MSSSKFAALQAKVFNIWSNREMLGRCTTLTRRSVSTMRVLKTKHPENIATSSKRRKSLVIVNNKKCKSCRGIRFIKEYVRVNRAKFNTLYSDNFHTIDSPVRWHNSCRFRLIFQTIRLSNRTTGPLNILVGKK